MNNREENKKAILKKLIDIKFDTQEDDRLIIDDETIFAFLDLLGDEVIDDIKAELELMY